MYEDEIRIRVEPNYMAAESSAAAERYAFSYRITIENRSDYTLTLRKRHWKSPTLTAASKTSAAPASSANSRC